MANNVQITQRVIPSLSKAATQAGAIPVQGEGLHGKATAKSTSLACLLRGNQTDEEKELWRALKAGRFAGVKFHRQHQVGDYYLDFYCPTAKLSIELDGFHHRLPAQMQQDAGRTKYLDAQGIEELRFWNHQVIHYFQEHLLSPAPFSIRNGGEGAVAVVTYDVRSPERVVAPMCGLPIPFPSNGVPGEGTFSFFRSPFISFK